MYSRHVTAQVLEALTDTPVVLIHGARQAGKSTLAQQLTEGPLGAHYYSLDEVAVLSLIQSDPEGFVDGLEGPAVFDEVQRAPELLLAIKRSVDRDRRPGRFLLTGSANILFLPRLSDSLAGRIEITLLWPLSQGELAGHPESLIDTLFDGKAPGLGKAELSAEQVWARALRGGYPEPLARKSRERRESWYASYLTTVLERDVRELANVEGLTELPGLLTLLAARAGGLVNYSDLARDSQIPVSTVKRYVALLEHTFLLIRLPAWSGNLSRQLAKSPKLYVNDGGLAAYLLGLPLEEAGAPKREAGRILETFVVAELEKARSWSKLRPKMFHYRSHSGLEVDVLLQARDSSVVGLEVKSASSVGPGDFRGLLHLREELGEKFRAGVVLYLGQTALPFGEKLWALPVEWLWRGGGS
ncbi:MAG TPA: ATP-binding protein [Thermoanaerobaculia bacterium]|nr:ATP-binding protein [Thermoanaerobaculia bacterium]